MTALNPGDDFPSNVTFSYIPYDEKTSDEAACGRPVDLEVSKGERLPLLPTFATTKQE
jgi:alkyl hydroperoxide reductase 1